MTVREGLALTGAGRGARLDARADRIHEQVEFFDEQGAAHVRAADDLCQFQSHR